MPVMTEGADRHRHTYTEVRTPLEVVLARVVSFIFGVIIAFIAIRFLLELFGANAAAPFVQFIYLVSDVFMTPFTAIFATQRVAGSTFEWSALIAILVYALISWGIIALIRAVSPREVAEDTRTTESAEDYRQRDPYYRDRDYRDRDYREPPDDRTP